MQMATSAFPALTCRARPRPRQDNWSGSQDSPRRVPMPLLPPRPRTCSFQREPRGYCGRSLSKNGTTAATAVRMITWHVGEPLKAGLMSFVITSLGLPALSGRTFPDEQALPHSSMHDQETYRELMEDYTPREDFDRWKDRFYPVDMTQRPYASMVGLATRRSTFHVAKDPETGKNIKSFKDFDDTIAGETNPGLCRCGGITTTSVLFQSSRVPNLQIPVYFFWVLHLGPIFRRCLQR